METSIPAIIDIEASGFGRESYPIEVGVVFANGEKFCRLIKPEASWTHWDPKAESVHRISREILETKGLPASQVAQELNERLSDMTIYSDCWTVDKPWLDTLFLVTNTAPTFRVRAIEMVLDEDQWERWRETFSSNIKKHVGIRHRASADAELIQKTWIGTRTSSNNAQRKKAG